MSYVIDVPYSFEDLDQVFDLMELLENKDQLIEQFKPEVSKLLVKKSFFTGVFRREYTKQFNELIQRLIRAEVVKHFNFSPEDIMLLTELSFLQMIAEPMFNPDSYTAMEAKSEH